MKTITTSVLGYDVPVTGVPESLPEVITAAGGEDQVVQAFNNYIRFHRTNTEARAEVAERVERLTGISRNVKKVKSPNSDKEREEWDESESDFVKRALAEYGDGAAALTPQILDGLSVAFNAQGTGRTGGPRRMAQMYTKAAEQLMKETDEAIAGAVSALERLNPGLTIQIGEDGKPTLESLAGAIKTNKERGEREANAAIGLKSLT